MGLWSDQYRRQTKNSAPLTHTKCWDTFLSVLKKFADLLVRNMPMK